MVIQTQIMKIAILSIIYLKFRRYEDAVWRMETKQNWTHWIARLLAEYIQTEDAKVWHVCSMSYWLMIILLCWRRREAGANHRQHHPPLQRLHGSPPPPRPNKKGCHEFEHTWGTKLRAHIKELWSMKSEAKILLQRHRCDILEASCYGKNSTSIFKIWVLQFVMYSLCKLIYERIDH